MNLGEKIVKLRKERGLSQETLAQQVGTTRQAISKWENNQGFPETEKLLSLSNIFGVSVDYLLKEERSIKTSDEKGYYVNKEMAKGYLANQKKICILLGLGFMMFASAGIPYTMIQDNLTLRYFGMGVCILLGITFLVLGMFSDQQEYDILSKEPLLFDYEVSKELNREYTGKRKHYIRIAVPSTVLFIAGLLVFMFTKRGVFTISFYHSFVFLGFAFGVLGFVYSIGMMEAYELLVKNEQHTKSFFFQVKRKIKEKLKETKD